MCLVNRIIFTSVVIVATLVNANVFGQAKKKNMQQIYYTQEGKAYILQTANMILFNQAIPLIGNVTPIVTFQQNAIPNPLPFPLYLNIPIQATKAVVPLMIYYSITDVNAVPAVPMAMVAVPFSSSFASGPMGLQIGTMAKVLTNAELIYRDVVNPTNFVQYGLKYNQVVLSESDFTDINPTASFVFSPNFAESLRNGGGVGGINLTATPNATVSISVLYFQFQ